MVIYKKRKESELMIPTFNLSKLNKLLQDFYMLTQIRITVFDESFNELVAYPQELSLFCRLIRNNPTAEQACHECDQTAFKHVAKHGNLHLYKCHAGLTECVVPIHLSNILIGYLFFGQVLSYDSHDKGWDEIQKLCQPYHLQMDTLKEICYNTPIISSDYIESASNILQAVAAYLCLEQMAFLRNNELPTLLDEYITQHYTENISVASLCQHFNIGKTQLYKLAKRYYGKGIAEHIRDLRLKHAKKLLLEFPNLRINEVADQCGFNSDYNYFITMFKKKYGTSPKAFRTSATNSSNTLTDGSN